MPLPEWETGDALVVCAAAVPDPAPFAPFARRSNEEFDLARRSVTTAPSIQRPSSGAKKKGEQHGITFVILGFRRIEFASFAQ